MFKNYLKVALRKLLKQKSFTFINIVGLAVGMACFIFILLYVLYELSYDDFHDRGDRIYRVAIERKYPDRIRLWGRTPFPLAPVFQDEYPEILQGTRLLANFNNTFLIRQGDANIYNNRVVFADPNFFDVFSITMVQGNPKEALVELNSAVLTRETARIIFGEEDVMGRTLNINNVDYTVTGITESVPRNSHFHYDYLLSLISLPQAFNGQQWINAWGAFTYLLIRDDADAEFLESKFPEMVKKYMAPEVVDEVKVSFEEFVASGNGYRYFLQPLRDIHLKSHLDQEIEPNGNVLYVYLFGVISVFILILACINFMNLTTARAANRAKEVGVRKTAGSSRKQLVLQFLVESTLLSTLALIIALIIVEFFQPVFNALAGYELDMAYFETPWILPGLLAYAIIVGFLAGSYPALFLSSFEPVAVLKGQLKRGTMISRLRNGLVIFQFAVSIVLIISTIVISNQIRFMLNKDLGFDKEHVIVIRNAAVLGQQHEAFKEALAANPDIVGTSGSLNFPGSAFDGNVHTPVGGTDENAVSLSVIFADYDYVETMGMKIGAGRNFSREFGTDNTAYILNETAARMLQLREPVGSQITDHFQNYNVIGVLRDFHFQSLHNEITPVACALNQANIVNFVSVRVRPQNIRGTLEDLENTWRRFSGGQPFVFTFLDQDLGAQYDAERKTRQLSGIFSLLAILIGCLGLFGLAAYTAEQRTKEIGVRKVLGASVPSVMGLMMKEFLKLVVLAILIASPFAYLALRRWLQNFAYSTELGFLPFLVAGALALVIALLTVSYQAVKAALRNPVESLRYE